MDTHERHVLQAFFDTHSDFRHALSQSDPIAYRELAESTANIIRDYWEDIQEMRYGVYLPHLAGTPTLTQVYKAFRSAPFQTIRQVCDRLHVKDTFVRDRIRILKKMGVLVKHKTRKEVYWEIVGEVPDWVRNTPNLNNIQ